MYNNPVSRVDPTGLDWGGPPHSFNIGPRRDPDICYEGKEITLEDIKECTGYCFDSTNPWWAGLTVSGISLTAALFEDAKTGQTFVVASAYVGAGSSVYTVVTFLTCLGMCGTNPYMYS